MCDGPTMAQAIPLVYTYTLSAPFDDYFVLRKRTSIESFGMNLSAQVGYEIFHSDQDNQPLMWLYRLSKAKYSTTDPHEANLFFIPLLPKMKRTKEWKTTCNHLSQSPKLEKRLLSQLPHLNETTAPFHFMHIGKSFIHASQCSGIFSKPVGVFKNVQRISNEATPWAYKEENLKDYKQETKEFYSIVNADEGDYPHHIDVPRPSSVHWRQGKSPFNVDTNRNVLMSYMGRPHGDLSVRNILESLCTRHPNHILLCPGLRNMTNMLYDNYRNVANTKLHAKFCVEPTGDTPGRKSVTDSLAFGCVPVFIGYLQKNMFQHLDWAGSSISINRTRYIETEGESLIQEIQKISDKEYTTMAKNLRNYIIPRIQLSLDDCNEDVLILTLKKMLQNAQDIDVSRETTPALVLDYHQMTTRDPLGEFRDHFYVIMILCVVIATFLLSRFLINRVMSHRAATKPSDS